MKAPGPDKTFETGSQRRLIDLSHTVEDGMVTNPSVPAPRMSDYLSRADSRAHYAPGTEFHIGRVDMVGNTGTYLDAPSHRFADGVDLAGLPLEATAELPAIVVRVAERSGRAIDREAFASHTVLGRAVLVHTGWDRHWGTPQYFEGYPHLTDAAARHLADAGAALVGIDSLNIDDDTDGARPVHTVLLRAGIPIVENLRGLDRLPADGFRFTAAPVAVRGLGSFPVRAHAVVPSP